MSDQTAEIRDAIKDHIISEFLVGEDPDVLTDDLPLISGGVLDSISTIKLVSFIEDRFGVQFEAHEVNTDYLDTLSSITKTVQSKLSGKA